VSLVERLLGHVDIQAPDARAFGALKTTGHGKIILTIQETIIALNRSNRAGMLDFKDKPKLVLTRGRGYYSLPHLLCASLIIKSYDKLIT
jgi:hypothetical protein